MDRLLPMALEAFKSRLGKRRVFCFGAGIQGMRIGEYIIDWRLGEHLAGFIDNAKAGQTAILDYRAFPIVSLQSLQGRLGRGDLIFITALAYEEIYRQLEAAGAWLNEVEVTSSAELARYILENSDYPGIVRNHTQPVIPKKIHYVWVGGKMPDSVRENIAAWQRLCPDYEIIEWNEKNYDMGKVPYMKEAYESGLYGYVPDYLRLDVVYEQGGIYLDTDIELVRNLDDLLYQDCFGCVDGTLTWNAGSGFGARPGAEILRQARDYYQNLHFRRADGTIDRRSCNSHQYEMLRKMGYRVTDKFQTFGDMNIYPMIFQGHEGMTGLNRMTEKTYWIHHEALSWFLGK